MEATHRPTTWETPDGMQRLPRLPNVPGLGFATALALNVGLWGMIATFVAILER